MVLSYYSIYRCNLCARNFYSNYSTFIVGDGLDNTWKGQDGYQTANAVTSPVALPATAPKPTITASGKDVTSANAWFQANNGLNTMIDNQHLGVRYENKNDQTPVDAAVREENKGFTIVHDYNDITRAYTNRFYNDVDTGFWRFKHDINNQFDPYYSQSH